MIIKNFAIVFVFLTSTMVLSQSLINNGSFEDITDCPTGSDNQIVKALFFSSASTGTPDLYHVCSFQVPNNVVGNQQPFDDSSYCGLYTYANQTESTVDAREYAQTQLNQSLNGCNTYKIRFYVSLADNSHYAINSIGAYVSSDAIYRNDFYCFDQYEPQVNNPASNMLSDKDNWIKIEGQFVASGGEQYLTIGNFHLDSEIDTFPTDNNFLFGYSYYYIDSISLIKIADETTLAYAGTDTAIFAGDSTFIGQDTYNLNCTWRLLDGTVIGTNISGLYVKPTETTTYIVEQNLCGNVTYDTIVVTVKYVGLEEKIKTNELIVYPNPSFDKIYVSGKDINEIKLVDLLGRKVDIKLIKQDENSYIISDLYAEGIYHCVIETSSEIKIVKVQFLSK